MQAGFTEALLRARSMGAEGEEALRALAETQLPLVRLLAGRMPWHGQSREELVQQGVIGLMKALRRYDPSQGTAFSTYAAALILGEMRQLRRQDVPIHIPRTDRELRFQLRRARETLTRALGREPSINELAAEVRREPAELVLLLEDVCVTSLDAPVREDGAPLTDLLPDSDPWLDRLMLRDLLSRLSPDDRQLWELRCRQGLSQAETAARLGLSQSQISRREKALRLLLRSAWLDESPPSPASS